MLTEAVRHLLKLQKLTAKFQRVGEIIFHLSLPLKQLRFVHVKDLSDKLTHERPFDTCLLPGLIFRFFPCVPDNPKETLQQSLWLILISLTTESFCSSFLFTNYMFSDFFNLWPRPNPRGSCGIWIKIIRCISRWIPPIDRIEDCFCSCFIWGQPNLSIGNSCKGPRFKDYSSDCVWERWTVYTI